MLGVFVETTLEEAAEDGDYSGLAGLARRAGMPPRTLGKVFESGPDASHLTSTLELVAKVLDLKLETVVELKKLAPPPTAPGGPSRGGRAGGLARGRVLPPSLRREQAHKAASSRWHPEDARQAILALGFCLPPTSMRAVAPERRAAS